MFEPLRAGLPAPAFELTDIPTGENVSLEEFEAEFVLLNFWSVECPWTENYDDYFVELIPQLAEQGIPMIMIMSNRNESDDDILGKVEELGLDVPVLRDENNHVADAYGTLTTPQLFVLDAERVIRYQGAVDDRTFTKKAPDTNYLEDAIAALLDGEEPEITDSTATGCTIVRVIN